MDSTEHANMEERVFHIQRISCMNKSRNGNIETVQAFKSKLQSLRVGALWLPGDYIESERNKGHL